VRHESLNESRKWGGRTCWPMFHAVNNNNNQKLEHKIWEDPVTTYEVMGCLQTLQALHRYLQQRLLSAQGSMPKLHVCYSGQGHSKTDSCRRVVTDTVVSSPGRSPPHNPRWMKGPAQQKHSHRQQSVVVMSSVSVSPLRLPACAPLQA
jgi:hypothetical protein